MSERFPPISLGAPGEEISKKDLFAVVQRFKNFNQARLKRAQAFLQPRQQDFLNLLPLLFHINHPLLPGFINLETPAGIPDYTPDKRAIETARQFSKGFTYKRRALRNYPIDGIYLMGSVGSMAFSRESDIDIWLCHQTELTIDELEELRKKADEVEKWAASLKLEVHLFLVDSQKFKSGENTPLSSESSGQAQHYLLLEEFYRTSIFVAGRVPVWWMVPPEQEFRYNEYVAHLLENRFIADVDVIDFGSLQEMPMTEFVSATLWHLYKSLTSPHKALLKLFLMESYASEFPAPQWLCRTLKQQLYQGQFTVDSLDPYLLIYDQVDAYLRQQNAGERLELARESFFIKIMGSTALALDLKARMLHENFLLMTATRWQWSDSLLQGLGSQKFWDVERAVREHAVIRDQLQQCLKMILTITGNTLQSQWQNNDDIKLLTRKLRARLDQRQGKVEMLTTRGMIQTRPEVLSLIELNEDQGGGWGIYCGKLQPAQVKNEKPIKRGEHLLELLSWMVLNDIYRKEINLQLYTDNRLMIVGDVKQLLTELSGFLQRQPRLRETELRHYAQANRHIASLLLINWGEAVPIDQHPEQYMMSERSDPLSYGDKRHCFVKSVQRLSVSNWGEVTLKQYSGLEGVLNCLTELFNQSGKPFADEAFKVVCLSRGRGRSIVMRIEGIFNQLLKTFTGENSASPSRYLLPAENGYCCFKQQNGVLSYYLLENNNLLMQELASPLPAFATIVFDDYVLDQTFIPFLYRHNLAETVQIFYHQNNKHVAIYIIDEKGAFFAAQHRDGTPRYLLLHYLAFLNKLINSGKLPVPISLRCYEIQRNSAGIVSCQPLSVNFNEASENLPVKIVHQPPQGATIYCNRQAFPVNTYQDFQAVRAHIMEYRRQRENYPFHLTDIEVSPMLLGVADPSAIQSLHYLNYKQKIEEKLNL